jgi:hypothetical protein
MSVAECCTPVPSTQGKRQHGIDRLRTSMPVSMATDITYIESQQLASTMAYGTAAPAQYDYPIQMQGR